MKNGRDDSDDEPRNDPKISRIEDARRARARGEKGAKGQGGAGKQSLSPAGRGSLKEWIFGGVVVAMAIGMVISFGGTVLRTITSFGG